MTKCDDCKQRVTATEPLLLGDDYLIEICAFCRRRRERADDEASERDAELESLRGYTDAEKARI